MHTAASVKGLNRPLHFTNLGGSVVKHGKAISAVVIAVVLLALGLVLKDQADFSRGYVKSQLEAHGITFTPAEYLLPSQKDIPCLFKNAGKPLTTGKQAECYAKYQIALDMDLIE